MPKVLFFVLISTSLIAGEYDFDMAAIEQKPYEYSGYLRVDNKVQKLNQEEQEYQNLLHLEALFDFSYSYEELTFKSSLMANYDYLKEKTEESDFPINELYLSGKLNTNHSLLGGKQSLNWGKGYFYNPVAFFDRPKDPTQPTQTREGFIIAKYSYNKSFANELKNISLDLVYLPSTQNINQEYCELATQGKDAHNAALRLYLLLYDTDIDILYNYSDNAKDKIGIDFSKNLQVNFEIHGEFAAVTDEGFTYLLGGRYLSDFDLTIIGEYLYQSEGLEQAQIESFPSTVPFIAKDYFMALATQKEPFEWLYFSLYYKNMTNLQDYSQQNKIGASYSFKNNVDTDISYNKNSGNDLSEFGKKTVSDFLWLQVTWRY
ncbi:hypothetical protein KJ877_06820 [bacterium]|nr:hypothetical protein [bacterium]MBU1991355.1 hypothetical protein [bacterium]